jgi:hypothetical protein
MPDEAEIAKGQLPRIPITKALARMALLMALSMAAIVVLIALLLP